MDPLPPIRKVAPVADAHRTQSASPGILARSRLSWRPMGFRPNEGLALRLVAGITLSAALTSAADSLPGTGATSAKRDDFVDAFSRDGDPLVARNVFSKAWGEDACLPMMKRLAGLYFKGGKWREATMVFRSLIRERPCHAESALFQTRIIDALLAAIDNADPDAPRGLVREQLREGSRMVQKVERECPPKTEEDQKALEEAKVALARQMEGLRADQPRPSKP
jgi:hypothetical protein